MKVPLLVSRTLANAGFAHGFSTREGGVSPPPYDTLDFALLREPTALRENLARLAETVGFDAERLHQARQVHGARLLVADGHASATRELEADGLVADPSTGYAVAVRVADCVPVLIADPASGRVAAVHAGWRGVELGIVAAGLEHLLGAESAGKRAELIAAIGPCIGPCCFEVGVDVAERIAASASADVIARRMGTKAFVDLRLAVRSQLRARGLRDETIDDVPGRGPEGCTRCDAKRFYSYRRDGDASGRLVGVIVSRGPRTDRAGSPS